MAQPSGQGDRLRQAQPLPTRGQRAGGIRGRGKPHTHNNSGVERGETIEVAALGNVLTDLFNDLGITQSAYAERVSMDKSIVSRYLRGRRLPPQDFIDRLVREVELHRHSAIQAGVKTRIAQLRSHALKVCDPSAYALESLRAEMEHARREIGILSRREVALHDLLDKRESQALALQGELEQMREDWTETVRQASRSEIELRELVACEEERATGLGGEVDQLRLDLAEATTLRESAELRCSELEDQLHAMEQELADARSAGGIGQLPLGSMLGQLNELLNSADHAEVARELTEAAATRSMDDISKLIAWLLGRGDFSRAERAVVDVVHTRAVEDISVLGGLLRRHEANLRKRPSRSGDPIIYVLNSQVCEVRSSQEIAFLHFAWAEDWKAIKSPKKTGDYLLTSLLRSTRSVDVILEVVSQLDVRDETANEVLGSRIGRMGAQQMPISVIAPRLMRIGRMDIVSRLWGEEMYRKPSQQTAMEILRMKEEDLRLLVRNASHSLSIEQLIELFLHLDRGANVEPGNLQNSRAVEVVFDEVGRGERSQEFAEKVAQLTSTMNRIDRGHAEGSGATLMK
jgi:transcriptional regulator with XRE-family HTH domain